MCVYVYGGVYMYVFVLCVCVHVSRPVDKPEADHILRIMIPYNVRETSGLAQLGFFECRFVHDSWVEKMNV